MKEYNDRLQKVQSYSTIIASILVPVAVVFIGNIYSTAMKESEIQVRYVELAVEILKEKPSQERANIRTWAINLINNFSEVEISPSTREELLKDPIFKDVDKFVAEKYAPYIVKHVISKPGVVEDFKNVLNSNNQDDISRIFTEFVLAAYKQIEKKKGEIENNVSSK